MFDNKLFDFNVAFLMLSNDDDDKVDKVNWKETLKCIKY